MKIQVRTMVESEFSNSIINSKFPKNQRAARLYKNSTQIP
ncbi:hypothetical protein MTR67_023121 [Solanum verrucosum]|uniref:Uncharacterized protein n=1 Tax=Solanum verrucosum TaxID=315347 RepID=A0AAF0TRJ3_SOLVR|nr:hypothetical protein MTR67_023121 [Solanum verrucosum]